MITKGIIKSIDYNGNTCTVRIPFFETANNDEIISTAPISNTPGSYNGYKVDDVVWVAFEDGSMDNPVVIGKLYLGVEVEKADPRGTLNVVDSKVSNSAEIPFDTKLGSNVADSVANTNVPFSSLEQVANSLNTAEVNIAQNDRDYGNRFKQTYAEIDATGKKITTSLEQTASDIRAEVKSTKETLEGTISETKAELLIEDGKISTRVEEVNKDLNGKIETTNSEIQQTASNINARITTKLDLKNEGWDYDENGDPIKTDAEGKELVQRSLGWDLTNDAWVIKAYDQNTGDTLPKEGLDIFKIKRDSLEINTPQVRLSDYPRKTIIRYAYGTKDTYPKLYANKNTDGNDIKSINDEFINGYDTNTKTNSIWSITELPWSEDKYVWQWTQTASYKYVIKNSNEENSGYWDDQIEDTVIRQSGDSAVSYWTNCQTLVHTGENHGSNIVVTAMRKAGTKNEEEDKLTKVIHANTGEEIVEYGGAFLWWRYKTISNEWKLAAAKYKINFTFPSEVPNDDIEIIATHDDTFNPNAEGVNISTDVRIYDKETIVYSPLNTPVISLSNDSAQINYLSDGATKAPEAADYVESEANLYLSGNKLTSNNISYNWEVIPTNGCTFEGNTNTALIKVKDIIVESVVVKCTISINNNGIDGKFKNTSYQKDFTITKAIQGDKGDTGESTYTIDIDNDFATIPANIINKQIYRINKFKPSSNSYSRQIVQATRALPSSRTLPGMTLSIMNETPILKTALTALPEETKTVNGTSTSYIENLSTHKVKVYYGTVEEEIDDKNLIIKLDHDDITEIPEGKFLVCEIGSFNKSGEITEDDYPGMNPTVENNTVTNYITTLGNNTVKSTNTYIKYSYYVNGINVASAKVELVRSEGPTTYYMTTDTSTIKTDAAGTIELLQIKVNSYKLATSDGAIEPFNGWWKYSYDSATSESWRTVSEKGGMKDGTENPLIIKGTEIQSAIKKGKTKLTIELYSDSAYTQLWDKEVINVIRDGNGIASQTTYYALVHSDYIADTIKAPTEDDKIVYSGTTNLINSKKALSNWSTTAPKHKLEKTDDPNTLGWKYWTSIRTEKADGTVEYSTPIISEDLNGVYALMQGKTRNYYSNIDPTISYNVQDGDCWFDTGESYRQATEKDDGANANGTFNSIDQYRGYYFKYNGNNYAAVNQSAIDNSMVTAGTTVAYKKETNLLKQYNNGAWEDIGSELVANKVTANFINAMDITAKKISILSNGNTGDKIFEADGTSGNNSVTIGGFNVTKSSLVNIPENNSTGLGMSTDPDIGLAYWAGPQTGDGTVDTNGNIKTYGTDAPFRIDHNGNLFATKGQIGPWQLADDGMYSEHIRISKGSLLLTGGTTDSSGDVSLYINQTGTKGILETNVNEFIVTTENMQNGFNFSRENAASSCIQVKATIGDNGNITVQWGRTSGAVDSLTKTVAINFYVGKQPWIGSYRTKLISIVLEKGTTIPTELTYITQNGKPKVWNFNTSSTTWDSIVNTTKYANSPNGSGWDNIKEATTYFYVYQEGRGANYSFASIIPTASGLQLGSSIAPWEALYVKKIIVGNGEGMGTTTDDFSDSDLSYEANCFDAGTKVTMGDGSKKNIEEIKKGDIVLSYNNNSKTFENAEVINTFETTTSEKLVVLTFSDGSKLYTTTTHPFYTTVGWVSLKPDHNYNFNESEEYFFEMMQTGQNFYKINKSLSKLELVVLERIQYRHGVSKPHKVYNLEVNANSTFFAEDFLSHNKTTNNEITTGGGTGPSVNTGVKPNLGNDRYPSFQNMS